MNAPLECIIQKYEKSTVDWKKGMSGKRSVIFREQDFKETGKRDFMNQLMELEMAGEGQMVSVRYRSGEGVVQPGTDGDYIPTTGKNTEVQAYQ